MELLRTVFDDCCTVYLLQSEDGRILRAEAYYWLNDADPSIVIELYDADPIKYVKLSYYDYEIDEKVEEEISLRDDEFDKLYNMMMNIKSVDDFFELKHSIQLLMSYANI